MVGRRARRLLLVALALGVMVEVLLHGSAFGLNIPIIVAATLAAGWRFRREGRAPDRLDAWLPIAALALAGFVAVRADPFLAALDTVAALGCTVLALAAFSGHVVTRRSASTVAAIGLWAVAVVGGGALRLLRAGRPAAGARRLTLPTWSGAVGRGLLLAVPLALMLATLFASADPIFRRAVDELLGFRLDLGDLPGRALFALSAAWFAAGCLALAATGIPDPAGRPSGAASLDAASLGAASRTVAAPWAGVLGTTEAIIVLIAVDLVATLFVSLQVGYLFGGLDTLAAVGMTYSDYARRGFFELVAAAGLAGGIIVGLDLALARRTRVYVGLALALVALTLAVLVSAAVRMDLYQAAYGWTELRLYVVVAIAALAATLVVMAGLLWRDRTRWLGHVLAAVSLAALVSLNVLAPAAFVAERNLARVIDPSLVPPDGRHGLDVDYLWTLGDDAIPVLAGALPRMPPDTAEAVRELVRARARTILRDPAYDGLAAWNLGRARAGEALGRTLDE
ncbi:MAG: DUF4153 domain-containing protein [Candidatus Limnocylindria bacterium]